MAKDDDGRRAISLGTGVVRKTFYGIRLSSKLYLRALQCFMSHTKREQDQYGWLWMEEEEEEHWSIGVGPSINLEITR